MGLNADPNRTVYIRNVNERIPPTIVKQEFARICGEYGTVLDVVARRSIKKRGQVFVVFDDIANAVRAHDALQNYAWQGKQLSVAYAYTDSNVLLSEEQREQRRKSRRETVGAEAAKAQSEASVSVPAAETAPPTYGDPHKVLLLKEVPESATLEGLQALLEDLAGFNEVRMFTVKNVAFIEFDTVDDATAALPWVEQQNIGKVSYAK